MFKLLGVCAISNGLPVVGWKPMSIILSLEAGKSFIMGSGHDGVSVSDANANLVTDLVDLDSLVVQPGSNIVDVEVFVAIA